MKKIGIIGGTGSLGSGLAIRWAKAGYSVIIGSRDEHKAKQAADELLEKAPQADVHGTDNFTAARDADVVVLTVRYAHHESTLNQIHEVIQGKILIDTTVPLIPPKVARVQLPSNGSAGTAAQEILGPDVNVVSAFQNISAELLASEKSIDCHVLVAGNNVEAREIVIKMAEQAGMQAWHAGPINNSAAAEAITSILIHINKRYGFKHAGISIIGDPE